MGLTAQYTSKKLIAFTPAEAEMLAMIAEQQRTTVSDVIRDAVRVFAKNNPELDRRALASRLKKLVSNLPAGVKRDAVKRDADGLIAFLDSAAAALEPLTPTAPTDSAKLFGD